MLKKTTIHYFLGLGLALLTIPIVKGTLAVLPDIGWYFITVIYLILKASLFLDNSKIDKIGF